MSPTLAEGLVILVIFITVVWMGILLLPTIARFFHQTSERVKEVGREAEREIKGDDKQQDQPTRGVEDNGKKQQG